jgi:hypothetical protein
LLAQAHPSRHGQSHSLSIGHIVSLGSKSRHRIRTALVDYVQTLWLQFAHTAAANANGTIEQRLARLLLLAEDRLDSEEIRLTHEQLATMLTVRRAGVTVALQHLESCRLINRERGIITIMDRAGLEAAASPLKHQRRRPALDPTATSN